MLDSTTRPTALPVAPDPADAVEKPAGPFFIT
jgi:hypothetical protein